jgi:hypothetical protein
LSSEITQAETKNELLKKFKAHLSSKLNKQAQRYQKDIESIIKGKLEALEVEEPPARQNPKLRELIDTYASQLKSLQQQPSRISKKEGLYPQEISNAIMELKEIRIHGYRFCSMLNNAALNPFVYIRKLVE